MATKSKQPLVGNRYVIDVHRYGLLPAGFDRLVGVRVYNCGQGDSLGIIARDRSGQKDVVLHVDYGGYQDNPHAKRKYKDCLKEWPIKKDHGILLTHWDQDHYWTGLRDPDLHVRPWLVPRQRVSPRVAAFSARLSKGECWPDSMIRTAVRFRTRRGDEIWVEKIARRPRVGMPEDRNITGLAVSLVRRTKKEHPYLIACPGDAPYSRIRHLARLRKHCKLVGLVAYHHGSHTHWTRKVESLLANGPTVQFPRVVYSCAKKNSYGHPTASNYQRAFKRISSNPQLKDVRTYETRNPYIDIRFPP